jgi:2-polyprenyl-6-methoxyphenol hydroxylase-like FAD-dependent oxidoreductase
MRRADLQAVLAEEMGRQGVSLRYEKRLTAIGDGGSHGAMIAHFADGTQAEGDILIGADGIGSATRRLVFPEAPAPAYVGIIGIGAFVPAAVVPELRPRDRESLTFTFGRRGFFGYGGARPDEVMWWSNLWRETELTPEELRDLSVETVKAEMRAIYRGYHAPIERLFDHTGPPVKLNIYDIRRLAAWSKGRVLLIGDAAHAVSPNAGQGASMALEDAMYLGRLLRDMPGYDQAFARLEHDRRPRVERVVAEGRRRGVRKKEVTALQSALRNAMLAVVLTLFGERSNDWLYRYRLQWSI